MQLVVCMHVYHVLHDTCFFAWSWQAVIALMLHILPAQLPCIHDGVEGRLREIVDQYSWYIALP